MPNRVARTEFHRLRLCAGSETGVHPDGHVAVVVQGVTCVVVSATAPDPSEQLDELSEFAERFVLGRV
ncbi:hypothetical protein [Nocardia lijiangensis]|uniref:hypothetical protein n=1 Tax=Nocardia lijiangensis TaxID=299618 RepID=UPI003D73945C